MSLTLVTGIFNLNREDAKSHYKRDFTNFYIKNFIELLKSTANINMIIYIESKYSDIIYKYRSTHNTIVRIKEIDSFKKNFKYYNQVSSIRKNATWLNQAGWLSESTQATMELYNPMVMSKMFLLNDESIVNPFNSEYIFWIDSGLTNTVNPTYFSNNNLFKKITNFTNKFLFLAFPYKNGSEIHGFDRNQMNLLANVSNVEYVCRGGFFGGKTNLIHEVSDIYDKLLDKTLEKGLMGTEESIFTLMTYNFYHLFDIYFIGENGLVYVFFESLLSSQI